MHGNRKDINKGRGTTWSLRDPQNRAKMAKIAKMDKNEGKQQVFVFIIEGKEKWIQKFIKRLDYNFPHLDMNENKVGCMQGPRGSLQSPQNKAKIA